MSPGLDGTTTDLWEFSIRIERDSVSGLMTIALFCNLLFELACVSSPLKVES